MKNKKQTKQRSTGVAIGKTTQKQLSNPISTGGGGVSYEARVQAVYLLAMFTGAPTALLPEATVVGLQFQAKIHGYQTDDLVCTLLDQTERTHKALLQVKRTIKASAANKAFKDAITAAWQDFINPALFTPGSDRLVVVYDADGDSSMQGAFAIADIARTSLSGTEFLLKVTAPRFSSPARRNAIAAIEALVVEAVGGPVHADELHRFTQHLWFISHHLSSDGTPEHAELLARIQLVLGRELASDPPAIWAQLVDACLRLNPLAASVALANLDSQITSRIAAGFSAHRSSGASHLALGGLLPDAALGVSTVVQTSFVVDRGDMALAPSNVVATSVVRQADAALSSSRPDSANKVISGQLDAINEKLKLCRYCEALSDIVTLGRDLGPFDTHQKARWYLQRGVCYWHLGQTDDAATDFLKTADLSDDDDKMVAARIRGLMLRKEIPEAIKVGEPALERFPESLHVWIALANARLIQGDSLTSADVPARHREDSEALLMLAWARRLAEDWPSAIELSLKSLNAPSAGFYTRHAALAMVVESATRNGVLSTYRLTSADAKWALQQVVDAFDPRPDRLWAIQAPTTVAEAATHLGYAFLLLDDPDSALKVVQEAQVHGITSPTLLRVELDALNQAKRTSELLAKGNAYVSQLSEEGLVSLGQAAANVGDVPLVEKILKAAELVTLSRPDTMDVLRAIRWIALWCSPLRSKATAEVLAASLSTSDSLPLILAGTRVLLGAKEEAAAGDAIAKAVSLVATANSPENVLLLAELLFDARKFEEAAKHYEQVLPSCQHSELHNRLLCCYVKLGSRRKAKKLIEGFPAGWAEDDGARSLAIELGQSAGDWPLLTALAEAQFKQAPLHASSWLFKFMTAVRSKPVAELRRFLQDMPAVLEGTIQQTAQLATQEFRYGLEANGMRRMYRLRRTHIEDVESASALFLTYLSTTESLPYMEEALPVVAPGTSFVVVDQNGGRQTVSIDPVELPDLPETIEFKQPSADEAKYFLGAFVGSTVTIDGNYSTTRTYKVESVTSAYRRLFNLASQAIEQSLKPVPNALSISIPTSPDGADYSQLHAQLKLASAHVKMAIERYETIPITLGGLGSLLGKNPIDVVRGWQMNGPPLFVCTGTTDERDAALHMLADTSSAYVIDAATMTEFVTLDCVDALAVLPKLFVSSTTCDIVQGKLEEARLERSSGQAFDIDGQMGFVEFTAEDHARNIRQLEEVATTIEKYCEVVPAYGPEVQNPLLMDLQKAISDEEHSVLLLAAERGAHLVTVDGRLRHWAAAALVQGVWPQVLLKYAVNKGAFSGRSYSHATARMFLRNRSFVSLSAHDLLMICHQGDTWLKCGIARYKKYLSEPGTEFNSAFDITLGFLRCVAQALTHMGAFAELLKNVVEGLLRHKDCPNDLMSRIGAFLTNLLRRDGPEYLYGPAAAGQEQELTMTLQYFRSILKEAGVWAQQPAQDRPLKVKVLMCGRVPWLIYSEDEALTTIAAPQVTLYPTEMMASR